MFSTYQFDISTNIQISILFDIEIPEKDIFKYPFDIWRCHFYHAQGGAKNGFHSTLADIILDFAGLWYRKEYGEVSDNWLKLKVA
jgi:hypothetical protein